MSEIILEKQKFKGFNDVDYALLSDKEIIDLVLLGNEEAILYLLYDRYAKDIEFNVWRYYGSLAFLEDLTHELYLHLKGKNADWHPLTTFQEKSQFRGWFSSVISHLFQKKRKELIDFEDKSDSIEESGNKPQFSEAEEENSNLVILLEAIGQLGRSDYRFVLLKELEGYTPEEIARMLGEKWKKENRVPVRKGKEVEPTAAYVYMIKARALKEVKIIVERIKRKKYEDN